MMKTLRLLVLLMCHYQDCQRRVQQEIDDVIGQLEKPTANHRKDMPYTEAVIMEMMRYVSQTPLAIPHKCNKDVILDGYLIEKDSGVGFSIHTFRILRYCHSYIFAANFRFLFFIFNGGPLCEILQDLVSSFRHWANFCGGLFELVI